jgi:tetratricopeptide (TPR) repeat protein
MTLAHARTRASNTHALLRPQTGKPILRNVFNSNLLNQILTFYSDLCALGDPSTAATYLASLTTTLETQFGPTHPNTLASRNSLATAYSLAGDQLRAVLLHEQNLADNERIHGPDHPDTLVSRNNLALAYNSAGDPRRAIALFERTLADSERVLGPDHPNTLSSRNNLAGAYYSAGDPLRAIPLLEQTLADRKRVLGPDHPDTLTSQDNLASAYKSAGISP